MSWRHAEVAGLLDLKRPPAKAVLLALCHHANQFTGECYPSIERLMLFTGLSRRSVQNALRELEELGHIITKLGNNKRTSLYTVTLSDAPLINQGVKPKGAARAPQGASAAPHSAARAPHSAAPAPEQSYNNQQNMIGRARPLHTDWKPDEEQWLALLAEFPAIDHDAELAQFIDKSQAKGETYANPTAALRSWFRHGQRFARRDAKQPSSGADALRRRAASADAGSPAP